MRFQQSLALTENLDACHIRIYDDCSTEFSITELKKWFPNAIEIIQRKQNIGPDRNLRQMYVDFLSSDDDILVTMDSDLICRPDWLNFTKKHFDDTSGVLSLYNSKRHKPTRKIIMNGEVFLEKNHIGAAGSILSRKVIQEIVNQLPPSDSFDWAWSGLLRQKGVPILVSNDSYFQHIGLIGYNCDGKNTIDYGVRFHPIHDLNKKLLSDFKSEFMNRR